MDRAYARLAEKQGECFAVEYPGGSLCMFYNYTGCYFFPSADLDKNVSSDTNQVTKHAV